SGGGSPFGGGFGGGSSSGGGNSFGANAGNVDLSQSPFSSLLDLPGVDGPEDIFGNVGIPGQNPFSDSNSTDDGFGSGGSNQSGGNAASGVISVFSRLGENNPFLSVAGNGDNANGDTSGGGANPGGGGSTSMGSPFQNLGNPNAPDNPFLQAFAGSGNPWRPLANVGNPLNNDSSSGANNPTQGSNPFAGGGSLTSQSPIDSPININDSYSLSSIFSDNTAIDNGTDTADQFGSELSSYIRGYLQNGGSYLQIPSLISNAIGNRISSLTSSTNNGSSSSDNPFTGGGNPFSGGGNPFAGGGSFSSDDDSSSDGNPFTGGGNPFSGGRRSSGDNDSSSGGNPFSGGGNPFAGGGNPFSGGGNPFAGGGSSSSDDGSSNDGNPFSGGGNPFTVGGNPFAGGSNPFAGGSPDSTGSELPVQIPNNIQSGIGANIQSLSNIIQAFSNGNPFTDDNPDNDEPTIEAVRSFLTSVNPGGNFSFLDNIPQLPQ
ncbi:MAG: hypothetical protein IGS39_21670, partial [Calothrix sp. C42_A2020_038]|nr:hypothetical protein [Calothrix sp. C42_A2020_038]